LLAGCNQIYGLDETTLIPGSGQDIDLDKIPDDMDPCIASSEDGIEDLDGDMRMNAADGCPSESYDSNPDDIDLDGIPDVCDPFPNAAGDRVRCVMSFLSPDINRLVWKDDGQWTFGNGALGAMGQHASEIESKIPLDGAVETTIDVRAYIGAAPPMTTGDPPTFAPTYRFWIRPGQAGCEATKDHLAVIDATGVRAMATISFSPASRLIVTFDNSGAVRCVVTNPRVEVRAQLAPIATGHVGFYLADDFGAAMIEMLVVYERDNAL
jgi:hypothetical protein